MWLPRPGDRILMQRDKRFLRGIVEAEHGGLYLTSCFPGEFLRSNQLFFVPRQIDYKVMLWKIHADREITLMETANDPEHFSLVRYFRKPGAKRDSAVHMAGSPVEMLSWLLELRISDAPFNHYINSLVLRPTGQELAN